MGVSSTKLNVLAYPPVVHSLTQLDWTGGNTTFRHPDAKPDHFLTEDMVPVHRALARHRMSLLAAQDAAGVEGGDPAGGKAATGAGQHSLHIPHHPLQLHQRTACLDSKGSRGPTSAIDPPDLADEGAFSALGKLALSSMHGMELARRFGRAGDAQAGAERVPSASPSLTVVAPAAASTLWKPLAGEAAAASPPHSVQQSIGSALPSLRRGSSSTIGTAEPATPPIAAALPKTPTAPKMPDSPSAPSEELMDGASIATSATGRTTAESSIECGTNDGGGGGVSVRSSKMDDPSFAATRERAGSEGRWSFLGFPSK